MRHMFERWNVKPISAGRRRRRSKFCRARADTKWRLLADFSTGRFDDRARSRPGGIALRRPPGARHRDRRDRRKLEARARRWALAILQTRQPVRLRVAGELTTSRFETSAPILRCRCEQDWCALGGWRATFFASSESSSCPGQDFAEPRRQAERDDERANALGCVARADRFGDARLLWPPSRCDWRDPGSSTQDVTPCGVPKPPERDQYRGSRHIPCS